MTPEELEVERVEFEAWYRHAYWNFSDAQGGFSNGEYDHLDIQLAWASRLDRAKKAHAERREMQETEQRLRAEIARLQAIASRAVPDGWKLVPVKPTEAMFDALAEAPWIVDCETKIVNGAVVTTNKEFRGQRYILDGWSAMLAAATQPQDGTP